MKSIYKELGEAAGIHPLLLDTIERIDLIDDKLLDEDISQEEKEKLRKERKYLNILRGIYERLNLTTPNTNKKLEKEIVYSM